MALCIGKTKYSIFLKYINMIGNKEWTWSETRNELFHHRQTIANYPIANQPMTTNWNNIWNELFAYTKTQIKDKNNVRNRDVDHGSYERFSKMVGESCLNHRLTPPVSEVSLKLHPSNSNKQEPGDPHLNSMISCKRAENYRGTNQSQKEMQQASIHTQEARQER